MEAYFKLYLGDLYNSTFVPPKEIRYMKAGKEQVKLTEPYLIYEEEGKRVNKFPIHVASFSTDILKELEAEKHELQFKLVNYFQNWFLQFGGVKAQPFFVTVPAPSLSNGLEKVFLKFTFEDVENTPYEEE